VAGAAGIDLVHLLAELLDNAVAFSPPTAPIVVTGGADGDGYLIEVTDRGLGMSTQEQAWANHRPASAAGDPGGDQAAATGSACWWWPAWPAATGSASAPQLLLRRRHRRRAPARRPAPGPAPGAGTGELTRPPAVPASTVHRSGRPE
jgi:hypothetical protein